jgi:hypothetical protein
MNEGNENQEVGLQQISISFCQLQYYMMHRRIRRIFSGEIQILEKMERKREFIWL